MVALGGTSRAKNRRGSTPTYGAADSRAAAHSADEEWSIDAKATCMPRSTSRSSAPPIHVSGDADHDSAGSSAGGRFGKRRGLERESDNRERERRELAPRAPAGA